MVPKGDADHDRKGQGDQAQAQGIAKTAVPERLLFRRLEQDILDRQGHAVR